LLSSDFATQLRGRHFNDAALYLLLALLAIGPLPASAHDGPHEAIAAITSEIERQGPSATRYYMRGSEYAALRNHAAAETDFRRSLALDRDFRTIQALARVLVAQERLAEAARLAADELARQSPAGQYAAEAAALDAEVLMAAQRWAPAVLRLNEALAHRADLDGFLLRSRAQAKLARHTDRIAGLRSALNQTNSPVVEAELCDAYIAGIADADRAERIAEFIAPAMQIVEQNLKANRYTSAWLLRRARLSQSVGNHQQASEDLRQAIAELDTRIHPDRPDVTLLAERAVAKLLLGQEAEAREDYLQCRKHRAPDWALEPLIDHFGNLPPPPTVVVD
jgi:tetratricopeptide (TPR) repeat protein